MKLFSTIQEKTINLMSRPKQIFLEIRGRELVLAEGYCRIEAYDESLITLASSQSSISIRGKGLQLRHLSDERIAVEGRIDSVEFI